MNRDIALRHILKNIGDRIDDVCDTVTNAVPNHNSVLEYLDRSILILNCVWASM